MDDSRPCSVSEYSADTKSSWDAEAEANSKLTFQRMKIPREGPVVIMPLDSSQHSMYCLTFYVKYIHKPENKIHVCYVAENYNINSHKHSIGSTETTTDSARSSKNGRKGLLSFMKSIFSYKVTVVDRPAVMGPSPGIVKELEHKDKANCKSVKSKVHDVLSSNDIKNWDFKRLTGEEPWTSILNFREEMGGTMIVLGSRGHGMIKRQILGSVSEKILRKSCVPVLIVRQPFGALSSRTDVATGSSVIS